MHLRLSLIAKFILATSLILLVFMGLLDSINNKNFRKVMIDYAVSNAEQVAQIINQSAYDAMMKNDKASLYQMIGRIAQSENIEHIRLIDQKGIVVFSGRKAEIGSVIGRHAEACVMCHNAANPNVSASFMDRSRIIITRSGKEALGFTKAIYNQPACSTASCHFHDKKDTVLGLLDISISLETLRYKSNEYRLEFVVLTCLLLLLIGALITTLTHYLVDIPLQRLVSHSALVALGDLKTRVPITSSDELGELSEAVNRMTESLEREDEELKGWADSLEDKVEERTREIKLMEGQLRRSEKLASLGTLAAGVAHEINNPLTGILLYASIINNDKRLDPELASDIERVISETRRCAAIVRNLLTFSRESVPVKGCISLDMILDDVAALFQQLPNFRNIVTKREYGQELPLILVDPDQIRQVFMNLVINAGHAMSQGGELKISTFLSPQKTYVCAEIRDTGCGISEENLSLIFDPFFSTKSEGTGLGLSISYGIVENNGGNIEVKSTMGEGSSFTVMLPVFDDLI